MPITDCYLCARQQMIRRQLLGRGITRPEVLDAFACIPRHQFVPRQYLEDAYIDAPVPIGFGQTISQPYIIAVMLEALRCDRSHRVLDIGAGCGYQSALLSKIAQRVYAIERLQPLAEVAGKNLARLNITNVSVVTADGSLGLPEHAPYDRIICAAATPHILQPWIDQLADPGIIIAPVGDTQSQHLVVVEKCHEQQQTHTLAAVRFVKLIGQNGFH